MSDQVFKEFILYTPNKYIQRKYSKTNKNKQIKYVLNLQQTQYLI